MTGFGLEQAELMIRGYLLHIMRFIICIHYSLGTHRGFYVVLKGGSALPPLPLNSKTSKTLLIFINSAARLCKADRNFSLTLVLGLK